MPALAERLEQHVRFMTAIEPPRNIRHPRSLDRVAAYIRERFAQAGWRVSEQVYEFDGADYRNVRALKGSEDAPRVVIGAHYDVQGPYPGADDNASAVAVLIELSQRLRDLLPTKSLELVAYTLEESPPDPDRNMGSAQHARQLAAEGVDVEAMLSLEMLGYFTDAPDSQHFPAPGMTLLYPSTGNFVAVVGRLKDVALIRTVTGAMSEASALAVHALASPVTFEGLANSDHRNFWTHGYTAAMVTDTAYYRNPNYHRASDTPDTLDYRRMAMVVEGLEAAIIELTR